VPYKYLTAGSFILHEPKEDYKELTQAVIADQFYNATDVYTIQEETAFASGVYQNVDVRLNSLFNPSTTNNVEDDFKKILFKELDHSVNLGRLYKFDNNHWITINVDKIKTLIQSVVIRRCNNTLRWVDTQGGYYEVPCVLDYLSVICLPYNLSVNDLVV